MNTIKIDMIEYNFSHNKYLYATIANQSTVMIILSAILNELHGYSFILIATFLPNKTWRSFAQISYNYLLKLSVYV